MVLRIGTDLVYIPGLENKLQNQTFLEQTLHPSEQENLDPQHLAGIIAAKEAFFKALGQPIDWLLIEVAYEDSGRPHLHLDDTLAKQITQLDISISHDKDYAIASVVLDLKGAL